MRVTFFMPPHVVYSYVVCQTRLCRMKSLEKLTSLSLSFAGTRVFRVYAEDKDESERNKKITYSIVSTDDKFSIDPETGWLSTNAVRLL